LQEQFCEQNLHSQRR